MTRRRRLLAHALAALALAAANLGAARAADQPSKWFRYGAGVTGAWEVSEAAGNPMQMELRHRHPEGHGKPRRIMVLYPRASSAYDIAITQVLAVFDAKEINAEITVIDFETDEAQGEAALSLAREGKYELIFAMGSESTAWLYEHYRGGPIPVVSICSKDPVQLHQTRDYDSGSGNNFAFTSLNMPIEVQMAYVQQLRPDLKNVAVLVDAKNVSAVQTQAEPIAAYARERGIQVIWGAVQDPNNTRAELAQIVAGAVRTMRKSDPDLSKSLFWITGSTSVFREIKTINEHSDRVPVVSVVPEVVKAGADTAVLAIGISFESNAQLAAIYAAQILDKQVKAGDLKVGVVSPPDIAVSFLKAREIGMRVPFDFLEHANFVYDYDGRAVRAPEAQYATEAPATH